MKVLIAVDQTEASHNALEWVLSSQWSQDCRFKILSVMPPLHDLYNAGIEILQTDSRSKERRELKANLENFLRGCSARLRESFSRDRVECAIAEGPVARSIVAASVAWQADMIVVGRRELGLVARVMGVSVSQEVQNLATCRVRAIRASDLDVSRTRRALEASAAREGQSGVSSDPSGRRGAVNSK